MKLSVHGWDFDFDKQATQSNYESVELCGCATCKNYYANVSKMPSDLRNFLEQFGIDIAKPIETWSTEADKENMLVNNNEIFYAVNGYAASTIEPCEPIAIGGTAIYPDSDSPNVFTPPNNFTQPYFILNVSNLWLPWTVEDSIDECYPEPRKFNQDFFDFMKRVWKPLVIICIIGLLLMGVGLLCNYFGI